MATPEVALGSLMGMLQRYDMQGVYATLLALARSVRDLKYLHDEVLPENCRLLRKDYLKLEDAFREMYGGAAPHGDVLKPTDLAARHLLEKAQLDGMMGSKFDLISYYADRLIEGSKGKFLIDFVLDKRCAHPSEMVPSESTPTSPSREEFLSDFCGYHSIRTSMGEMNSVWAPHVGLEVIEDGPFVWVRFAVWRKHLTEPWVHQMLPYVQEAWANTCYVSGEREYGFFLYYFFPSDLFTTRFTVSGDGLIASPEFLDELTGRFCERNIPVSNIRPVAGTITL